MGDRDTGSGRLTAPARLGWSVRAHLVGIVVAVVLVFVVAGVYTRQQTLDTARRNVRTYATFLAGIGAEGIGEAISVTEEQVSGLAGTAGIEAVLDDPASCQLAFSLDIAPSARLDLFTPDGDVLCTSSATPGSHANAPWLDELARADKAIRVTNARDGAVVVSAPIRDGNGTFVAGVAGVVPIAEAAQHLADRFGGPRNFEFAVLHDNDVVASSAATSRAGPFPHDYLIGGKTVDAGDWRVLSGVSESTALTTVRGSLTRSALTGLAMLFALLGSIWVVSRRIARPLRRLTDVVIDTGPHVDVLLGGVRGPSEVRHLADAFRTAIAERAAYEDQLAHQALHDPLTGLPNRALLAERLRHSLEHVSRTSTDVAVLFLDLDRFKLINDGLGHAIGDEVLKVTAKRLADVVRPGDTLARFGGDEFVVVGEAFTTVENVEQFAARILNAVQVPIAIHQSVVTVTASIGISEGSAASRGADLLRDADTAMYLAKERGGARYEVFDDDLRSLVTTRLTVENDFRIAFDRDELHLVYQPKVDLDTNAVVGVEALLRWNHPTIGAIPPMSFIPMAEETGLIVPVGEFVLLEACRQGAAWLADGLDIDVAVNISARQLVEPSLVEHVSRTLQETGFPAANLCLELTESVLLGDTARTTETLAHLDELGVQLSIDDFGTGFSSLAYLHRFPVDELKIDRMFVHGMTESTDQRSLVAAMVAMGDALGLRVVAEGVETQMQADELRTLGCHCAQGYLFAMPQAAGALRAVLDAAMRRVPLDRQIR